MNTTQFNKFGFTSAKVILATSLAAFSFSVNAGTATENLAVSATVSANCTISTSALDFGAYDPIVTNASNPKDANGTVTVACTSGSTGTITLGQGANAGGGSTEAVPVRRMLSGSDLLAYQLYQETGRTTVWGNTSGTGVARTGTGATDAVTVYGRVSGGQNVPAGSYSDTVVATVTF